ncbi:MAG: hypothetical protein KTR31_23705 [Myxococcales bacterium]|nr:hypothetical protein [Myxococcales bacterium]
MMTMTLLLAASCDLRSEVRMDQRTETMQGHADAALTALAAFESEDLEGVRRAGKAVSESPPWAAFPPEARRFLEATRASGLALSKVDDWARAATALGGLADSCGSCHAEQGVVPSAPAGSTTAIELWLAVALRDDARWNQASRGADRLASTDWQARSTALGAELGLIRASGRSEWIGQGLGRHMESHFAAATDAVWFLALGDLDGVRERAPLLQHGPHPGLPEDLHPLVGPLSDAAGKLAHVTSVADGAPKSVALAERCAACHKQSGAIGTLTVEDVRLPEMDPVGDHVMAPYLLWVGLLVPSDAAWQEGSRFLRLPPELPEGAQTHTGTYEALATRASEVKAQERGALFAELIQTCVPCHTAGDVDVDSGRNSPIRH